MKKGLLALAFATATIGTNNVAYANGSQRQQEEQHAKEARRAACRLLIAIPNSKPGDLCRMLKNGDFSDFDYRDAPYLDTARRQVLGNAHRRASEEEITRIMQAMHKINLTDVTEHTMQAIADPTKNADDIQKALNGYCLPLPGGDFFGYTAIAWRDVDYIDEARKEVLGDSKKQASRQQVIEMMKLMDEKGMSFFGKTMGIIVGICAILLAICVRIPPDRKNKPGTGYNGGGNDGGGGGGGNDGDDDNKPIGDGGTKLTLTADIVEKLKDQRPMKSPFQKNKPKKTYYFNPN
jgi:hypothetical protein